MAVNPDLTIRYAEVDLDHERLLAGTPPDDDGPVWMVKLMKYRPRAEYADGRPSELTGEEAHDRYAPFEAFDAFPSKAAFFAVAMDPNRLSAQAEHREPALADAHALILRPLIDRLQASFDG